LAQRDNSSLSDDILLGAIPILGISTGIILYKVFENFMKQGWGSPYGYATPTVQGEQTLDIPPVLQTPYPPIGKVVGKKNGKDKDKDKKKKKHGKTTTTTTTNPEGTTTSTITEEPPSTVTIPAGPIDQDLQPTPIQVQPTTPGQTTSTTPTTTPTGTTFKPVGKTECHIGNLSSHGKRDTCRWNFDATVGDNDYAIDCDVTLGQGPPQSTDSEWPKDEPRLEITSGGPGSTSHNCCGWTVAVNNKDGTLHLETEDWSPGKKMSTTGTVYLARGTSISNNQPIFGKTVHIRWVYQSDAQGNAYYSGYAALKGLQPVYFPVIKNPTSPGLKGAVLIPGHFAPGYKKANDPSRIRVDSAGLVVDFHGGPTVTILGKNTYKQGFGYYHPDLTVLVGYGRRHRRVYQSNLGVIDIPM
jgi:hypothetical protein